MDLFLMIASENRIEALSGFMLIEKNALFGRRP